jgi:hypothetical protein
LSFARQGRQRQSPHTTPGSPKREWSRDPIRPWDARLTTFHATR